MLLTQYKVIFCDYINPLSDTSCDFVIDGAMRLRRQSDSVWVFDWLGPRAEYQQLFASDHAVTEEVDRRQYVALPAFVDLHFHWVQDAVRSMPKDNLLDWLKNFTWPHEHKFNDSLFCQQQAKIFAQYLLRVGTLAGACYGSIHPQSVISGLENFVGDFILGNVIMTENSPSYLTQKKENVLAEVEELAQKFRHRYAFTPRFAPTVDHQVMLEGGLIAGKHQSFIQTHLSETPQECDYVMNLYREEKTNHHYLDYTDVYDHAGLLGAKTIMGHGIYLSDREFSRLAETSTAIAHCPTSNAPLIQKGLGSGLFDFQKANSFGVQWGLASDIGGGPLVSMIDVIDSFVRQNRAQKIEQASYIMGLYRATKKSAEILSLSKTIGELRKDHDASFILLKSPRDSGDDAEKVLAQLFSTSGDWQERERLESRVCETYYAGENYFSQL